MLEKLHSAHYNHLCQYHNHQFYNHHCHHHTTIITVILITATITTAITTITTQSCEMSICSLKVNLSNQILLQDEGVNCDKIRSKI